MILKRALILLLLFVACNTTLFAQDYKENIKKSFSTYYKYLIAGEFDKSLDYTPPALFKIVPRPDLASAIEAMMSTPEMDTKLTSFEITNIFDRKKIEGAYYVKMINKGGMTLKIKSSSEETVQETDTKLNSINEAFIKLFGAENVSLDLATNSFSITAVKTCWAISVDGLTDWRFLTIEEGQRPLLEKILPKEIVEESFKLE